MRIRNKLMLLLPVAGLIVLVASAYPQDKFRLKPGAKGKACLACHSEFQEKLKRPYVHTPLKTGDCSGCHNPHASSHKKMLDREVTKICAKCHAGIVPGKPRSVHKVVLEGNCMKCHDPHSSGNKFNLLASGNSLCYGCHKTMEDAAAKVKFKHNPVEKGCITCHNPHASENSGSLLTNDVPALCVRCHRTDTPTFGKQHMNYPVAKADCTSCHNTHGSNTSGILYDTVHRPVAVKQCNQCHEEPSSRTPLKTKREGYELCRGCHNAMVNETLSKNRLHYPVVSGKGCQTCHAPHASMAKSLLKGPTVKVCGGCHMDTIERQGKAQVKHKPAMEGACTACHNPHAADNPLLIQKSTFVDLCGVCHDWQKHVTHPIGEKVVDPRNKNLTVQCLSCHRSHGTDSKYMLYFATISEMCTQCHIEMKR
jgi:predicted CXXCH cytochrome family protein